MQFFWLNLLELHLSEDAQCKTKDFRLASGSLGVSLSFKDLSFLIFRYRNSDDPNATIRLPEPDEEFQDELFGDQGEWQCHICSVVLTESVDIRILIPCGHTVRVPFLWCTSSSLFSSVLSVRETSSDVHWKNAGRKYLKAQEPIFSLSHLISKKKWVILWKLITVRNFICIVVVLGRTGWERSHWNAPKAATNRSQDQGM